MNAADIVDRLRAAADYRRVELGVGGGTVPDIFTLAADEIETLQKQSDADEDTMLVIMAENRRLRERIRAIVAADNAHARAFGRDPA